MYRFLILFIVVSLIVWYPTQTQAFINRCLQALNYNGRKVYGNVVTTEECAMIREKSKHWRGPGEVYNDGDHIIDNIYLGNVCAAHNESWLHNNTIDVILNMASEWAIGDISYNGLQYMAYPLEDATTLNIKETARYLNSITGDLLRASRRLSPKSNILIHCNMGISRSTSVLIRYMQVVHHMTYSEAYSYIKRKRPVVKPNRLFEQILRSFDTRT